MTGRRRRTLPTLLVGWGSRAGLTSQLASRSLVALWLAALTALAYIPLVIGSLHLVDQTAASELRLVQV